MDYRAEPRVLSVQHAVDQLVCLDLIPRHGNSSCRRGQLLPQTIDLSLRCLSVPKLFRPPNLVSCSSFLLFRNLANFRHRFGEFLCATHGLFRLDSELLF